MREEQFKWSVYSGCCAEVSGCNVLANHELNAVWFMCRSDSICLIWTGLVELEVPSTIVSLLTEQQQLHRYFHHPDLSLFPLHTQVRQQDLNTANGYNRMSPGTLWLLREGPLLPSAGKTHEWPAERNNNPALNIYVSFCVYGIYLKTWS